MSQIRETFSPKLPARLSSGKRYTYIPHYRLSYPGATHTYRYSYVASAIRTSWAAGGQTSCQQSEKDDFFDGYWNIDQPAVVNILFFPLAFVKWNPLPYEPWHDKTNKMTFVPGEDSDQPGHPPSLSRVFAVHMKKHWAPLLPIEHTVKTLIRLGRCPG